MTLTVNPGQIREMSRREREQYIREQLAFDGPVEAISEYFASANLRAMFNGWDFDAEETEILRETARHMLASE